MVNVELPKAEEPFPSAFGWSLFDQIGEWQFDIAKSRKSFGSNSEYEMKQNPTWRFILLSIQ